VSNASTHEPPPTPGKETVWPHVLADIEDRIKFGRAKHGTYLQSFNGRDALFDAYQEAIDLVMYLRQAILERDAFLPSSTA
jgi:hypothetical protein